jgi:hypothetical protein
MKPPVSGLTEDFASAFTSFAVRTRLVAAAFFVVAMSFAPQLWVGFGGALVSVLLRVR